MTIPNKYLFAALLLSGALAAGASDNTQPELWDFQQCLDYASSHNIQLQQSQLTVESGKYDLEAAKAKWFPTLDFATSHGYTNYPSPADGAKSNSYAGSYGLNAQWTLFDGGSRSNSIKRQQLQTESNNLTVEQLQNYLSTEILSCYLQVLYAKESIDIANQTVEVSKTQKERAEQLMKSGRLSRVDYAQLESQYQSDVYNVVSAQTNYDSKIMSLKKILELDIESDIALATPNLDDNLVLSELPDKIEVFHTALAWLPEMKSSELQQQINDTDIKIARSGYYPTISLSGSVGASNASGTGYSFGDQLKNSLHEQIGVTLSVPIFNQKTTKTAVAKAKVDRLNADLNLESTKNDISQTIESIYLEAQNAQAKYISGKEKLKSAELTDELTNEQFRLGLVNPLELLTSHNNLLNARLELLQSKYLAILNIKLLNFYNNQGITLP